MNLDSVIYPDNYPSIDLHGLDRESARVSILDFINENYKMGNPIFCIVHGIGTGILQKTCHEILKDDKRVAEFKTFYYNNGCTIVRIIID